MASDPRDHEETTAGSEQPTDGTPSPSDEADTEGHVLLNQAMLEERARTRNLDVERELRDRQRLKEARAPKPKR